MPELELPDPSQDSASNRAGYAATALVSGLIGLLGGYGLAPSQIPVTPPVVIGTSMAIDDRDRTVGLGGLTNEAVDALLRGEEVRLAVGTENRVIKMTDGKVKALPSPEVKNGR